MAWKIGCLPGGTASNLLIVVSSLTHQMAVAHLYECKELHKDVQASVSVRLVKKEMLVLKYSSIENQTLKR